MAENRIFLLCLGASLILNSGLWPLALDRMSYPVAGGLPAELEDVQIRMLLAPTPRAEPIEEPAPLRMEPELVAVPPAAARPLEALPPEERSTATDLSDLSDLSDIEDTVKQYIEVPPETRPDLPPIEDTEFVGVKPMRAKDKLTSTDRLTDLPRMEKGSGEAFELQEVPFFAPLLPSWIDVREFLPTPGPEVVANPSPAAPEPPLASIPTPPAPSSAELVRLTESTPVVFAPDGRVIATPPAAERRAVLPTPGVPVPTIGAALPSPTPLPVRTEPEAAPTREASARRLPPYDVPNPGWRGEIVMDRLPASLHYDPAANAVLYGEESFNIRPDEYAPYYKYVRDHVGRYWFTMMASFYAQRGYEVKQVEHVVVRFTIERDGTVANLKTVMGTEDPVFESICLRSIQAAGQFAPLPAYVAEPRLKIIFNFMRPLM